VLFYSQVNNENSLRKERVMDIQMTDYKISKHCEERYAQRLLNKEDANSINKFIVENKEKIKTDINKMVSYGDLLYVGKQSQKDGKGNVLNVYLKDTWIVLVDIKAEVVVTLYKIDLGCGDEFNLQYISKMMEKLNMNKDNLVSVKLEVEGESITYKELIDNAQAQINEYKSMIKNLENMCEGYQTIIDNNRVKVSQANMEVVDVLNTLIGKKEF
jgi:hypothetical protein